MPVFAEALGYRDFIAWLECVSGPTVADSWSRLVQAFV